MDRRSLLRLARSGLVATAASSIAFPSFAADKKKDKRPVALLVPLTGPRASLGLSMRQAALLAENARYVQTLDTGGTAQGAAAAAAKALKARCAMILGPLLAEEVPAVAGTVAGRVPVIAFTNDAVLRAPNTYVFGITPRQVTNAVLRYARGRGVRSVALLDDASPWSAACAVAAAPMEAELGLRIRVLRLADGESVPLGDDAPDAVLIPGSTDNALAAARNLKHSGIQLLGTLQALDHRPETLETLEGAWLATPDPDGFGAFASEFSARNGSTPGAIAALAYDAAAIVNDLRGKNALDAEGLLQRDGFRGVTGPVRFRTDGSVARDFAIVVAAPTGYKTVAVSSGA